MQLQTLTRQQIAQADRRGADLLSMAEYGRYDRETKQRIRTYLSDMDKIQDHDCPPMGVSF